MSVRRSDSKLGCRCTRICLIGGRMHMRRVCPGMFFAMNSVFIGIATMLYVFNISKAKDEDGREIIPEVDFRGFIRYVRACSAHMMLCCTALWLLATRFRSSATLRHGRRRLLRSSGGRWVSCES